MKSLLIASVLITNMVFNVCKAQLSDALMLTVSSGPYSDQTAIRFLDVATDYFDSEWDAYKLRNTENTPNFCSDINHQTYSINALKGAGKSIDKVVPLSLKVAFSGSYTITAEEIGLFDSSCSITLVDHFLEIKQNLKANTSYTFQADVNDSEHRFSVSFNVRETTVIQLADQQENSNQQTFFSAGIPEGQEAQAQGVKIYNHQGTILIEFEKAQTAPKVSINNLSGNTLVNTDIDQGSNADHTWAFTPEKNDLYIVNFLMDGKLYSEKIYIQR